jgi:hypothetical protein
VILAHQATHRHPRPRAELMDFNCVEYVEETLWGI